MEVLPWLRVGDRSKNRLSPRAPKTFACVAGVDVRLQPFAADGSGHGNVGAGIPIEAEHQVLGGFVAPVVERGGRRVVPVTRCVLVAQLHRRLYGRLPDRAEPELVALRYCRPWPCPLSSGSASSRPMKRVLPVMSQLTVALPTDATEVALRGARMLAVEIAHPRRRPWSWR